MQALARGEWQELTDDQKRTNGRIIGSLLDEWAETEVWGDKEEQARIEEAFEDVVGLSLADFLNIEGIPHGPTYRDAAIRALGYIPSP